MSNDILSNDYWLTVFAPMSRLYGVFLVFDEGF